MSRYPNINAGRAAMNGSQEIPASPASYLKNALDAITLIGTSPAFTNEEELEKRENLKTGALMEAFNHNAL
jgi:hypothetical protein